MYFYIEIYCFLALTAIKLIATDRTAQRATPSRPYNTALDEAQAMPFPQLNSHIPTCLMQHPAGWADVVVGITMARIQHE